MKSAIAAGEATRTGVADALAASEQAISEVDRKLRALDSQRGKVQNRLDEIGQRRLAAQNTLATQQAQLGRLIRDRYVASSAHPVDPFASMLSGADPNALRREAIYSSYVARAEKEALARLRADIGELEKIGGDFAARNAELADIARERQWNRATLLKEQAAKRRTLSTISDRLSAQRREAGALERDEQRLARVVDEIAKRLERQATEAREREKKRRQRERELARERQRQRLAQGAQRAAQQGAPAGKPGEPEGRSSGVSAAPKLDAGSDAADFASGPRNEVAPAAGISGNFAALKGRLRLPVRGEVVARYGQARTDGGPTWKGVFIRAISGTEVRASASGRVAFAEWLRGFGNLLIIDHGDQYLSIYGNNETLLKQVGETVKSGDVLASVGNTGGNQESGLYFELRYKGRPFDPMSWATLR